MMQERWGACKPSEEMISVARIDGEAVSDTRFVAEFRESREARISVAKTKPRSVSPKD